MSYKQIQELFEMSDNTVSATLTEINETIDINHKKESIRRIALKMDTERWTVYDIMFAAIVLVKMLGVDADADESEE